jgi:hypothetical protein
MRAGLDIAAGTRVVVDLVDVGAVVPAARAVAGRHGGRS